MGSQLMVHSSWITVHGSVHSDWSVLFPTSGEEADRFIDVGATALEKVEPSSSDDDDDSSYGVSDFSSDNGDSSEAEQGRLSTSSLGDSN